MNTRTLNMEVFTRSLTHSQMRTCENDEKALGAIFATGWSESAAVQFHRTMLAARRVEPGVTVEGVFEVALSIGLSFLGNEDVLARLLQSREDDVIVYGLQRVDGKDAGRTSGAVSSDVAAPVKRRKRGPSANRGVS
jgi:hypothetical protein